MRIFTKEPVKRTTLKGGPDLVNLVLLAVVDALRVRGSETKL